MAGYFHCKCVGGMRFIIFCLILQINSLYGVEFKTVKLFEQYKILKIKNPHLHKFIESLPKKCDAVITDIYRTKEEQIKIYGYLRKSKHMDWKAVDIRTWNLTSECIRSIMKKSSETKGIWALRHKVKGNADHIHIEERW